MKKMINNFADELIAVGDKAGQSLYLREYKVIHNGINLSDFYFDSTKRQSFRKAFNLSDDCLVLGHVGRLSIEKNQAFLLELIQELKEKVTEVKLILVGDGTDYKDLLLEKIDELGLSKHVIFTGNVSNVHDYYHMMDVFIFPSLYEGIPLSMVEAQANGLEIIASNRIDPKVNIIGQVTFLDLEADQVNWINYILNAKRNDINKTLLKDYDLNVAMQMVYKIYQA